jgi:hypothetical protein
LITLKSQKNILVKNAEGDLVSILLH